MDTKSVSLADACNPATGNGLCTLPANGLVPTIQSSAAPINLADGTLAPHLPRRLVEIGVNDVFTVPGDFNLTLLDYLIAEPGLMNLIGCCNELNAGYAADCYARAPGVGACFVTFTVGGLSALNAIAGAYSENRPVICIVGGPNSNDYSDNRIIHHTIGLPDFSQELRCFQTVTCYQVRCEEDLVKAIDTAVEAEKDCLYFIEVTVHKDDTSKELIEWGSRVCAANRRPPNPQVDYVEAAKQFKPTIALVFISSIVMLL